MECRSEQEVCVKMCEFSEEEGLAESTGRNTRQLASCSALISRVVKTRGREVSITIYSVTWVGRAIFLQKHQKGLITYLKKYLITF